MPDDRARYVDRQFAAADRQVTRAAAKIERAVDDLLNKTCKLECVAPDYVLERLIADLIRRNPKALDYLNEKTGEATMRVANALMDWRDLPTERG